MFTAVAVWTADDPEGILESVCRVARNNHNRLVVVGIGTQSPGTTKTSVRSYWKGSSDVRIASLQDMRALRYIPCPGGEFCFDAADVRAAIVRKPVYLGSEAPEVLLPYVAAIPTRELSRTYEHHQVVDGQGRGSGDLEAVLMAAKVVLSCVTEDFVPWNLDEVEEWKVFSSLVAREGGNVFRAILDMAAAECARVAHAARGLSVQMQIRARGHLVRLAPIHAHCRRFTVLRTRRMPCATSSWCTVWTPTASRPVSTTRS